VAGRWFGAYAGLVVGLHLVGLSRRVAQEDYRADPGKCLGCARCFRYCPVPRPAKGNMPG
jgi:L-lactate utilization protein LutB